MQNFVCPHSLCEWFIFSEWTGLINDSQAHNGESEQVWSVDESDTDLSGFTENKVVELDFVILLVVYCS